jgi:polyphosphate kinase
MSLKISLGHPIFAFDFQKIMIFYKIKRLARNDSTPYSTMMNTIFSLVVTVTEQTQEIGESRALLQVPLPALDRISALPRVQDLPGRQSSSLEC